jgi:glucosylceramidase
MTELCCAASVHDALEFGDGDTWGNIIFSDLEAGASAWIYWNAILDQTGGPYLISQTHNDQPGNTQAPLVVISRIDHTVQYTGRYYYLTHFSKFVRPGAQRVQTTPFGADGIRTITFHNADGRFVAVILNSKPTTTAVQLDWRGRSLVTTMPPTSIATLQWAGPQSAGGAN